MAIFASQDYDSILRLLAATGAGMLVGLNRDLSGKPTGTRTLGLVALGAALVSIVGMRVDGLREHPDAMSRVVQGLIQGILTGIGFVGAGVVVRDRKHLSVYGLTTAAAVWATAAIGIACALASWPLVGVGVTITLVLLVLAKPLDTLLDQRCARKEGYDGHDRRDQKKPPPPPDDPQ